MEILYNKKNWKLLLKEWLPLLVNRFVRNLSSKALWMLLDTIGLLFSVNYA